MTKLAVNSFRIFSPNSVADPTIVQVAGRVQILNRIEDDDGCVMYRIRNIDNDHECVAFTDELMGAEFA